MYIFEVLLKLTPELAKGQLILKADWRAINFPKEQTDEFVLFAFLLFTANKSSSSVHFLGESMARHYAFLFYLTIYLELKNTNIWQK